MSNREPASQFELRGLGVALVLLALLAVSQVILFSGSFAYFFQGDSLYWMAERHRGWGDFLQALRSVDSYGYFRPLSHPLLPSLLFPLFGLNPTGYHVVTLALFLLTTWLAHLFFRRLSGSDSQAFLGALFFGVHSTHVFVTFDFAFAPELLYGLFYLLSALFFVSGRRYGLSIFFFVLSLLSKEAAVTLPLNLFLVAWFLSDDDALLRRLAASLKAVIPHLVVLLAYFGYLAWGVRGGAKLLASPSGGVEATDRAAGLLGNLGLAFLWGFNLPGGWQSAWRMVPLALEAFLVLLALACAVALGDALIRPDRRKRLIPLGFLWFVVGLLPMLPLTEFKPYYLYAPLLGLSLAVGTTARRLREAVPRRRGAWGDFALILSMAMLWQSCHWIARQDLLRHPLLGPAAQAARQAFDQVRTLRRDPPPSAIFILDGTEEPLWWRYAGGRLFQLAFEDPKMPVLFASLGQRPNPTERDEPGFLALRRTPQGLIDVTEAFRADPESFLEADPAFAETVADLIEVRPAEVVAGEGRYVLRIGKWRDREVEVRVRRDEGPVATFKVRLDGAGEAGFFVSRDTPPGRYEFQGARAAGQSWARADPPALLLVK